MLTLLCAAATLAPAFADAPKLTIVISIDQFRRDYVTRFSDLYLPPTSRDGVGGFRWLAERGANFVNSQYTHIPTETGPGHAIIGTGSDPSQTGIVGNEWYDRKTGKVLYCVTDEATKDVHTGAASFSPKNLQVSTFCDELERSTAGMSKTASVALKDRAAILMAGRMADDVVWFDTGAGRWTTSDFYAPRLPAWAGKINAEKRPDAYRGKTWDAVLPEAALKRASIPDRPGVPASFGNTFPHTLADAEGYYGNWTRTPFANKFVLDSAFEALSAQGMGLDSIPDLLTINLSSNDYVGHSFGPDSPEVMEISVATDKHLAEFFRAIDKKMGLRDVLIIVTADHGVMQMAEEYTKNKIPGGRIDANAFYRELVEALEEEEEGAYEIAYRSDQGIYLRANEEESPEYDDLVHMFVRDWLRDRPEVYTAFTSWEFEEQKLPDSAVSKMAADSYHPERSPDVTFFTRPGYLLTSTTSGTSHGSAWEYDRAVPLLMAGRWMQPGKHTTHAGPKDIAATVCALWGIVPPSGSVGRAIGIRQ